MIIDTYNTIKAPSKGIYKEKGSKFLSFAYPIYSEDDFKEIQKEINKEFHDARHRCFAYRIGMENYFRVNDDGEPSNSAGKPILGQIQSKKLTNILIYVVRYFGGTLLGVGGLINAYKLAALDAINNAIIITKTVNDLYKLTFQYEIIGDVMRILKEDNIEQFDQDFAQRCELKLRVRKRDTMQLIKKFDRLKNIKCQYLKTE